MRRVTPRKALPALLLLGLLAGAFAIRVWGSRFGLPAYTRYHPDEWATVERAASVLWTGDWNLRSFNYPPFYAYVQTIAYAAYFVWGAAKGAWNLVMPFALPQYYFIGRLLSAAAGTLTILAVYLIGRQLRGKRSALLAAALLAGCYLHVIHSHYATPDVMVGLLVTLTLLFSQLLRERRETRWYFFAGLSAGLAGAAKYNGAVALVIPLVAHALATSWSEWGWLNGRLLLTVVGFLLGFFGGNPFALSHMPDFLNGLATVFYHYGTQHPGFEGEGNWRWYIGIFLSSADAAWVVSGILGLVHLAWKDWKKGLLVICFPLLYFLMMSRLVVRFERNMVPVLPFLALGGALLLDQVADVLARRFAKGGAVSHAIVILGAALLVSVPLVAAVSFDHAISQTDHREIAGGWVETNIVPGSKIAIESYSIPFDHSRYQVEDVVRISDHNLDWYRREGFDVLIISDGVWEVLRQQSTSYADKLAVYDDLTQGSTLLKEFERRPPGLAVAGYPTVGVYHFAPVRIYRIER